MVIVYSPNSARFEEVDRKVIQKSRKLPGWMILKYEVKEAPLQEDAGELAKIIRKDDLVIAAGGDGTAAMVTNAILLSGKKATLAVMPFGNFNDFAETLGKMSFERVIKKFEEGRYIDYYPLDIKIDNEHYVYASVYFTVGMMAEAARIMKRPKVRKKLIRAKNRMAFSARKMFFWYVKNKRRKDFLPLGMKINGRDVIKNVTDYIAMNGKTMAGVVPADGWLDKPGKFWSGTMRNRSFWRMFGKFVKAIEGELPGKETEEDILEFPKKTDVFVHAEGEGGMIKNVKKIEVLKNGMSLRVISS